MTELSVYTEGDVADIAICKKVADMLQKHFPGHEWLVNLHEIRQGVLVISLPEIFVPPSMRGYGYLLHLSNADDERQVRNAGGEWLERIGLARERAREWAMQRAREHGLDLGGIVLKSRA